MSRKPSGTAGATASRSIVPRPPSSASLEVTRSVDSAPLPVPSEGILPIRTVFSCPQLHPGRNSQGMKKAFSYAGMNQTRGSIPSSSIVLSSPSDRINQTFETTRKPLALEALMKSMQDREEFNDSPDYSQSIDVLTVSTDAIKNLQRRLILERNKIAYAMNTSTSSDEVLRIQTQTPQESCLLSIKDASPITDCGNPQQVPSQQQFMVQTLPGQYHDQDLQMQCVSYHAPQLPQVQQAYQVQQSNEPQNQVQVQHVQYRRESKAQHQPIRAEQLNAQQGLCQAQHQPIRAEQLNAQQGLCQAQHQPIRAEQLNAQQGLCQAQHQPLRAEQLNMQQGQYQAQHQPILAEQANAQQGQYQAQHQPILAEQANAQQGQYQVQHQPQVQVQQVRCQRDTQPQVELVCSEHTVENQIKELRGNVTKQLKSGNQKDRHSSTKLQSQAHSHNIGQKPQDQLQPFYKQWQYIECQSAQPQQQQCEPQGQPQTLALQQQVQVHQPTQLCHRPVQRKPVISPPATNDGFVPGVPPRSRVCGNQPIPESTALYDYCIRSNDLDLSFCSSDFKIGSTDKGDTHNFPSLKPSLKSPSFLPSQVISAATANAQLFSATVSTGTIQSAGEFDLASFSDFASTTSTSTSGTTGVYSAPLHLTTTNSPQSGPMPVSQQQPQHQPYVNYSARSTDAMEFGVECNEEEDYNDVWEILETIDQEDFRDHRLVDAFRPPLFQ